MKMNNIYYEIDVACTNLAFEVWKKNKDHKEIIKKFEELQKVINELR